MRQVKNSIIIIFLINAFCLPKCLSAFVAANVWRPCVVGLLKHQLTLPTNVHLKIQKIFYILPPNYARPLLVVEMGTQVRFDIVDQSPLFPNEILRYIVFLYSEKAEEKSTGFFCHAERESRASGVLRKIIFMLVSERLVSAVSE